MGIHEKVQKKFNPLGFLTKSFSQKGKRFNILAFNVVVVLPVLLAALYYIFLASDRYVSQARVLVKLANGGGGNKIELSLLSAGGGLGMREPLHVKEYITSNDMLRNLNTDLQYREHVSDPKVDIVSRLNSSATTEDFHAYYLKHVKMVYDEMSSILTIQTDAFSPEYAQQVLHSIVKNSEKFLNETTHQLAREQMSFVEKELASSQNELREAKQRILEFQSRNKMVSPLQQAESLTGVIHSLNGELVKEEAALKGLLSFMDPRSMEVIQAKQRIKALEQQMAAEKKRLAGGSEGTLTELQGEFQSLELDLEFAMNKYKTALSSLEQARIEAYRKLIHLVVIEAPTLPQDALYPRKLYNIATLFVFLCFIYGLIVMVAATIREHK